MTGYGGETSLLLAKAVGAGEAETKKGADNKKNAACLRARRVERAGLIVFFFAVAGQGWAVEVEELRNSAIDYLYSNHYSKKSGQGLNLNNNNLGWPGGKKAWKLGCVGNRVEQGPMESNGVHRRHQSHPTRTVEGIRGPI
jgi:hypothetical protein